MTEGPTELILHLPWPPSVNGYWRTWKSRMILSARGRRYREDTLAAVLSQVGTPKPLMGRLHVGVELRAGTARELDIDNFQKGLLDALTKAGIYGDDSQIDKLEIERGPLDRPHGSAIVVIKTIGE